MSSLKGFDGVVSRMMQRFGTNTKVIIPSENGSYDSSTSEYVNTNTEYDVRVLVFDYTLQSNGNYSGKDNLIEAGDKQVFIQPISKTDSALSMPKLRPEKDFIMLGEDKYRVVTVKEVNPSLQDAVLFELLARK